MVDKIKTFIKRNRKRALILIFALLIFTFLYYLFTPVQQVRPSLYRIGIDESWYSLRDYDLYDKEGDLAGFSEDMLQAVATKNHFQAELVPLVISEPLLGLDRGFYEGVLTTNILSEAQVHDYLSSDPYYYLGPILVVPHSSAIKSLEDVKGKYIGVINRFHSMYSLEKLYALHLVLFDYNDRYNLVAEVLDKKIDGMILNPIPAYEYVHGIYEHQLKIASAPLNDLGLSLITKNTPEGKKLIQLFNLGLKEIKEDGTYHKQLVKWQLFNPE